MTTTETIKKVANTFDAEILEETCTNLNKDAVTSISAEIQKINDKGEVNKLAFTDKELEKCRQLTASINMHNFNSIQNFGTDTSNSLSGISGTFNSLVDSSKAGQDIENLTNQLYKELSKIDIEDMHPSELVKFMRKTPILKWFVKSFESIVSDYRTSQQKSEIIIKKLQSTRLISTRDNNALQHLLEKSVEYSSKLEELVIAGKLKIEDCNHEIDKMIENGADGYDINRAREFVNNLEIRVHNLEMNHAAMIQMKPKISMVQSINIALANKSQIIETTTMPLIEAEIALAQALNNTSNSIKALQATEEYTNNLLKVNAENIHKNAVAAQKLVEQSVISPETIKKMQSEVLSAMKDIHDIHIASAKMRKESSLDVQKTNEEFKKLITETAMSSVKLLEN